MPTPHSSPWIQFLALGSDFTFLQSSPSEAVVMAQESEFATWEIWITFQTPNIGCSPVPAITGV